jgi:hypothetical protein
MNGDQPRAFRSFSLRTMLEVVAVMAVLMLLFRDGWRSTGRYQVVNSTWGLNSNMKATYLVDTQTGETWYSVGEAWAPMDRKK